MPTYEHICNNTECNNAWEDMYSINADPPKVCPLCKQESAQRVISGGSGKGMVELTGHDLVAKTKEDIVKLKSDMHKSDKMYANMLGDDKYHALQTKMDKNKSERGRR